jgi:hypothetical protein
LLFIVLTQNAALGEMLQTTAELRLGRWAVDMLSMLGVVLRFVLEAMRS